VQHAVRRPPRPAQPAPRGRPSRPAASLILKRRKLKLEMLGPIRDCTERRAGPRTCCGRHETASLEARRSYRRRRAAPKSVPLLGVAGGDHFVFGNALEVSRRRSTSPARS